MVWLQLQMARMAAHADSGDGQLPARYWRFAHWWESLGYPAFVAMLAVFALTGTRLGFIDTSSYGSINSVAIHNGLAAFAIEADPARPLLLAWGPGGLLALDGAAPRLRTGCRV